jgi:SAM-dependent MidA family methyltransferase
MHIDWPGIAEHAQAKDLRVGGFADQHHFLTGIVSTWPDLLEAHSANPADIDHKTKRALQTLLHPEMLGRAFQALALSKNVDPDAPRLAGFKFAREPHSALGLGNPN